ncbi:MAG: LCP family protein [bacterium]|nr:LCP family protein [bacterium]
MEDKNEYSNAVNHDNDKAKKHEATENKIVIKKDSPLNAYISEEENTSNKKKIRKRIAIGSLVLLLAIAVSIVLYTKHLLGFINYKDYDQHNNVVVQDEEFDTDDSGTYGNWDKLDPGDVEWNNTGEIKKVEGVTNLLFIAEEKEDWEIRGRSDVIIIVTVNTNDKTLKLTSIMRDTYVQIPGYQDNRINSAYRTGDIPLLEKTLKMNFNIAVDGYIKVDFDSFAKIIDRLGGVELTLTAEEADWLNESNHVLDKASRNLTAGTHRLNGAQALGYSRIRKIKTVDGITNDFGRVWRQKLLLTKLFNDYKDQSLTKIVSIAPDILSLITSDLPESKLISLAMTAIDLNVNQIETLCVPVNGSYESKLIRKMAVLVPDLEENIAAINSFIYNGKLDCEYIEEKRIEDYQINFSLTESNFKLKSIDSYTKTAFNILQGKDTLTLKDVLDLICIKHK